MSSVRKHPRVRVPMVSPGSARASQTHLFDGEPQEVREEAPRHVGSLRGPGDDGGPGPAGPWGFFHKKPTVAQVD